MALSAVTWNDRTYFARWATEPRTPHSSVTQLVQGLYELKSNQARFILRGRILTTEELVPINRGMVRTAATKATVVPELAPGPEWIQVSFVNKYEIVPVSGEPMAAARQLAGRARREGELYRSDRPVGCVLQGPDGALLGGAANTNRDNRTCHAEVNLLQGLGTVPAGSTLYTTLEPCRMCQGMVLAVAPDLRVRYLESDAVPDMQWKIDSRPYV